MQGDFPGTPKIAEMLAIGGAGGCIPVFVLKLPQMADNALTKLSRMKPQPLSSREGLEQTVEEALARAIRASMPYSRWLDYCTVSLLASERQVRANASGLLDVLDAIPLHSSTTNRGVGRTSAESNAQVGLGSTTARRQNLRRIRHAFGFWSNSSVDAPSATDYIFAEICAHAQRFRGYFRQQGD